MDLTPYLGRITSEHRTKPRFMALLEARLSIFGDIYDCADKMHEAFDLDVAVGRQLDVIGGYVGVGRMLTFQPKFSSSLLGDDDYRVLIRAKIFLNQWDGTLEGIHGIWDSIFPSYALQVQDNQDMTMKVIVSGVRTMFEEELIQHGYITPKPMGVLVNFASLFSWLVEGAAYAGGYQVSRDVRWGIGLRPPPPDTPLGSLSPAPYIIGAVASVRTKITIPSGN